MKDTITVTIGDDGSLNFVLQSSPGCEAMLAALREMSNTVTTRRASHVLPVNPTLRTIFRWLRDRYGEKGWIATFTRHWPCLWQADLAPFQSSPSLENRQIQTPILGPFRNRQDAIDAEIEWLERNI